MRVVRRFFDLCGDKSGVTAIEYALVTSLISIVAIALWNTLGTNLRSVFTAVGNSM